MTAVAWLGRVIGAMFVVALVLGYVVLVLCLAVVAVGVLFDAITGGL